MGNASFFREIQTKNVALLRHCSQRMNGALIDHVFCPEQIGAAARAGITNASLTITPANKRSAPGLPFCKPTIAQIGFNHSTVVVAGKLTNTDLRGIYLANGLLGYSALNAKTNDTKSTK